MDFQINGQSQEFFTTVILSPELEKTSEQIWQIWGGKTTHDFQYSPNCNFKDVISN